MSCVQEIINKHVILLFQGPEPSKPNKVENAHAKSMSSVDTDAYKTVDFLKTEAFNITRQDAEASRSFQY